MMGAYYRRLTGDDETTRLLCAQRWSQWEMATSRLFVDENLLKRAESDEWALQFARIEWYAHIYMLNWRRKYFTHFPTFFLFFSVPVSCY